MNQRELAEELEVSQTAISLVLNDPETVKVSASTRDKILNALQEHQYRISKKVLALKKIYFISNSTSSYQRQLFLDGIFQYAEFLGIEVELKSVKTLLWRKHKRYDGIGCILHGTFTSEDIAKIQSLLPVCYLNPPPAPYLCDSVMGDSHESMRRSILHLMDSGIESFALWGFPNLQTNESETYFHYKVEAFRALFGKLTGKDPEEHMILMPSVSQNYEALIRLAQESLEAHPDFKAFIATSYLHARILYEAAIRSGRHYKIISCGYSEIREAGKPQIEYITCDLVKMGKAAAAQVLKRAEYPEAPICSLLCCPEPISTNDL